MVHLNHLRIGSKVLLNDQELVVMYLPRRAAYYLPGNNMVTLQSDYGIQHHSECDGDGFFHELEHVVTYTESQVNNMLKYAFKYAENCADDHINHHFEGKMGRFISEAKLYKDKK